ncbi:MAG TPA: N-acetylmuramoyl-L-alanine amidase [Thermoleophilaceae bacterium]|jgi:N-acetylmuramoyl-L-alanine amidase
MPPDTNLPVIVIDPGHGGTAMVGGSSPNNATGPNGLLEKNVTLDLAQKTASRIGDRARVILTRDSDVNLGLEDRAFVARDNNAALFLSIHMNGFSDAAVDGTEAWVAVNASQASRDFAQAVLDAVHGIVGVSNRGVRSSDLGVLLPARHAPGTAATLVEVAFLTNAAQAAKVAGSLGPYGYLDQIAEAMANACLARLPAVAPAPTPPATQGLSLGNGHSRPAGIAGALAAGDGAPFVARATDTCFQYCEQLRAHATDPAAPNRVSAERIRRETGIAVQANPYAGITRAEIEAVVRAGFNSHQMPEVLLALWSKEGSTQSVTTPLTVHASTEANARTLFRSHVFYEHLGTDHFIVVTARPGQDNTWDSSDAAAAGHEAHFAQRIQALTSGGFLDSEVTPAAVNAELNVTPVSSGVFTVLPTTKFYALSLLLADAYFTQLQRNTYPQLASISPALNYVQWNGGTAMFTRFLASAETHRREPQWQLNGQPRTVEQWALETQPRSNEWAQPRINAVKFRHLMESYRPIFELSINLIKPGIEDLNKTAPGTAVAGLWATGMTAPIDPYRYDVTGTSCARGPQPGTIRLRDEFRRRYSGRSMGIFNCRPVRGGTTLSLHGEGRALDWGLNANDPTELAAANAIVAELLATDADGNPHALARRMGVQEIIWNRQIWTAGSRAAQGMRPYGGVNPHTDHIHVGQNHDGAQGRTSFWAAAAAAPPAPAAPAPSAGPAAPAPGPAEQGLHAGPPESVAMGGPQPTPDQIAQTYGAADYASFAATQAARTDTVFGHSVTGLLPEFLTKLQAAEATLRSGTTESLASAADWERVFGIQNLGGWRSDPRVRGMHPWGLAIDVNYLGLPYIMHEAGEAARDVELGRIYHRISRLILGRDSLIPGEIVRRTSRTSSWDTRAWYRGLYEESEAMKTYFRLLANPADPQWSTLLPSVTTERWETLEIIGPPPPTPDEIGVSLRTVMARDYVNLGGADPAAAGGTLPTAGTWPGDAPFVVRNQSQSAQRDPRLGFLNMSEEVVVALRDGQRLRWGAIDFGGASGDVMHFDDKNGIYADLVARARSRGTAAQSLPSGLGVGPPAHVLAAH